MNSCRDQPDQAQPGFVLAFGNEWGCYNQGAGNQKIGYQTRHLLFILKD